MYLDNNLFKNKFEIWNRNEFTSIKLNLYILTIINIFIDLYKFFFWIYNIIVRIKFLKLIIYIKIEKRN